MWKNIIFMWHHHPIMLIGLAILLVVLGRLLVQRLFQWVTIVVLVILIYVGFMYASGKRTKDQLLQQGKQQIEKIKGSEKTGETPEHQDESEKPLPTKRHAPHSE